MHEGGTFSLFNLDSIYDDKDSFSVGYVSTSSAPFVLLIARAFVALTSSVCTAAKLKVCLAKSLIKVSFRHFQVALSWRRTVLSRRS